MKLSSFDFDFFFFILSSTRLAKMYHSTTYRCSDIGHIILFYNDSATRLRRSAIIWLKTEREHRHRNVYGGFVYPRGNWNNAQLNILSRSRRARVLLYNKIMCGMQIVIIIIQKRVYKVQRIIYIKRSKRREYVLEFFFLYNIRVVQCGNIRTSYNSFEPH